MSNSNLYCKLKDAELRIKRVRLRVNNEVLGVRGGVINLFKSEE